jgi:hypothetical protein
MRTLADVPVLKHVVMRALHPDVKTSLNTMIYAKKANPQPGSEPKPRAPRLPDSALL